MDSDKNAALLVAIRKADLPSVRLVLKSNKLGTDEKWTDYTLLVVALQKRRTKIVNLLLDKGCRVRKPIKTNFFYTPLYYAVRLGNIELVKKLLVKGASITDKDRNKETPLSFAMDSKSYKIVDLMLSMYDFKNMDPENTDEITHFYIACRRNKQKTIRRFVEHGMFINSCVDTDSNKWPGYTPLHFATDNLSVDAVKFLLKSGADITAQDVNGLSPLHLAYFKELEGSNGKKGEYCYYTMKLEFLESKLMKLKKESIIDRILIAHTKKSPNSPNPVDNRGISHFHIACARDTYIVELFLEYGVDVNKPVSLESDQLSGYTPLHIAVANLRLKTIRFLLQNGAHVNAKAKKGLTPLHLAVDSGKIKIIQLLLENNADVNVKNDEGSTPLHCAFYATFPDNDVINLLLHYSSKADNSTDSRRLSHFHIACTRDNVGIVKSFLKNKVSVNSCADSDEKSWSGFTALYFAIHYNQKSIVELLLQNDASTNSKNSELTALHLACSQYYGKFYNLIKKYEHELAKNKFYKAFDWSDNRESQTSIIKLLLQYKADVNARDGYGKTPLMHAHGCDINDVLMEVDGCLNPEEEHYDFLEDVKEELSARRKEIIQLLLSHDADVNVRDLDNKTLLHSVCNNIEHLDLVAEEMAELFLSKGADVNAVDNDGMTPLHLAVENGERKIAETLLKFQADVNRKDYTYRRTALHMATHDYHGIHDPALIRTLVASGSDPNARDAEGRTALHNLAQLKPYVKTAKLYKCLLEKEDCDVNVQDQSGKTPLYVACHNNNALAVRELLRYGADVNVGDHSGKTVLNFVSSVEDTVYREVRDSFAKFELVQQHVTKLATAGFAVNKKLESQKSMLYDLYRRLNRVLFNESIWNRMEELDGLHVKCRAELEKMRRTSVDSYSSLYSILFKDQQEMTKHAKNERFAEILKAEGFEEEFPLYGYLLKLQYRRGMRRSVLLAPAKESLDCLRGQGWPDSCSEQIFRYLSDEDLKNLTRVKEVAGAGKRKLEDGRNEEDAGPSSAKVRRVADAKSTGCDSKVS